MTKRYIITAGDNSTDLGVVGRANTILGAKRIGRSAVRGSLPNQCGSYRVKCTESGDIVYGGRRSMHTDYKWHEA